MLMLSNANEKNREHAEHIFGTYLQYADHSQCIPAATLPIALFPGADH